MKKRIIFVLALLLITAITCAMLVGCNNPDNGGDEEVVTPNAELEEFNGICTVINDDANNMSVKNDDETETTPAKASRRARFDISQSNQYWEDINKVRKDTTNTDGGSWEDDTWALTSMDIKYIITEFCTYMALGYPQAIGYCLQRDGLDNFYNQVLSVDTDIFAKVVKDGNDYASTMFVKTGYGERLYQYYYTEIQYNSNDDYQLTMYVLTDNGTEPVYLEYLATANSNNQYTVVAPRYCGFGYSSGAVVYYLDDDGCGMIEGDFAVEMAQKYFQSTVDSFDVSATLAMENQVVKSTTYDKFSSALWKVLNITPPEAQEPVTGFYIYKKVVQTYEFWDEGQELPTEIVIPSNATKLWIGFGINDHVSSDGAYDFADENGIAQKEMKLVIPSTIHEICDFDGNAITDFVLNFPVTEIELDGESPLFTQKDGILYDKNGKIVFVNKYAECDLVLDDSAGMLDKEPLETFNYYRYGGFPNIKSLTVGGSYVHIAQALGQSVGDSLDSNSTAFEIPENCPVTVLFGRTPREGDPDFSWDNYDPFLTTFSNHNIVDTLYLKGNVSNANATVQLYDINHLVVDGSIVDLDLAVIKANQITLSEGLKKFTFNGFTYGSLMEPDPNRAHPKDSDIVIHLPTTVEDMWLNLSCFKSAKVYLPYNLLTFLDSPLYKNSATDENYELSNFLELSAGEKLDYSQTEFDYRGGTLVFQPLEAEQIESLAQQELLTRCSSYEIVSAENSPYGEAFIRLTYDNHFYHLNIYQQELGYPVYELYFGTSSYANVTIPDFIQLIDLNGHGNLKYNGTLQEFCDIFYYEGEAEYKLSTLYDKLSSFAGSGGSASFVNFKVGSFNEGYGYEVNISYNKETDTFSGIITASRGSSDYVFGKENEIKEKYGIPTAKLAWNSGHGENLYYLEATYNSATQKYDGKLEYHVCGTETLVDLTTFSQYYGLDKLEVVLMYRTNLVETLVFGKDVTSVSWKSCSSHEQITSGSSGYSFRIAKIEFKGTYAEFNAVTIRNVQNYVGVLVATDGEFILNSTIAGDDGSDDSDDGIVGNTTTVSVNQDYITYSLVVGENGTYGQGKAYVNMKENKDVTDIVIADKVAFEKDGVTYNAEIECFELRTVQSSPFNGTLTITSNIKDIYFSGKYVTFTQINYNGTFEDFCKITNYKTCLSYTQKLVCIEGTYIPDADGVWQQQ